jgi:pullulanase
MKTTRPVVLFLLLLVMVLLAGGLAYLPAARASDTPDPGTVTLVGSLQSELGCPGDWQPECAATFLLYDPEDDVWQSTFTIPAGSWEYKVALNGSWDENYGAHAARNGPNINLTLAATTDVKFYYSHETHWITDRVNSVIATAPGNYQDELGCDDDWDPSCLRSWLQDPDGDNLFYFETEGLPAGDYEVKVAHDESWAVNYGAGGVPNGPNIPFTVATDCILTAFEYDLDTHLLTVSEAPPLQQPDSVTLAGSFQSELGCPGDWQPECAATNLTFDPEDEVWQATFDLPAGSWEYKAALNGSWDENYGLNATRDGANIQLALAEPATVKFYYSHDTHWITDNQNSVIATAPGNYQSEIGCFGDWDPSCLRSWLQDPDGDGYYTFGTRQLPPGQYEVKVAINESWDENYGDGGVPGGPNIPFSVPAACMSTYFTFDWASKVLTVGAQGAPQGNLNQAKAHWLAGDLIAWNIGEPAADTTVYLYYAPEGGMTLAPDGVQGAAESMMLAYDGAGLPAEIVAKFPHLAGYEAFRIEGADVAQAPVFLKGQVAVAAVSGEGVLLDATGLQIPGVLDDLYTYDGPLGATIGVDVVRLALWAPTAQAVSLHLFADSNPATTSTVYPMAYDPTTGVWSAEGDASWVGQYYLYEVVVYAPETKRVEHNLVTDPYSLSLAANSTRSQIVDVSDPALMPEGWQTLDKPALAAPEDIVLYELHIRDFSWYDADVPEEIMGTYLAFTLDDSAGMRHLRALAGAGLTHLHLLPSFDITTVPEWRDEQVEIDPELLASYPPDSPEQQALINAVRDQDGFNWGYDPYHYSVPEGSYATDPDGPARIREYRAMVQALNEAGLRVVADVVYNHTSAAGQNPRSVLDRIVPGYYHRLNANGGLETSTCCANTATEHAMMEKLMLDSLVTWATVYKIDGFRFDLMGHHMVENMTKARDILQGLTEAGDGVDGSAIYIYGEGWNFGEVANGARGLNATQFNVAGTGIGSFNDRIRDGVRGGGPFDGLQDQGFATGLYTDPNSTFQGSPEEQRALLLLESDWIRLGLAANLRNYAFVDRHGNLIEGYMLDYKGQPAGYTLDPQEIINYISAHDNETWFDAIQLKVPLSTSMDDRVRVQNLGLSLVALGQGVPFFHAGSDMLRSKDMDRDSYNSGDWFNNLDFTYQSNNWGIGLPIADKNQDNWQLMQPLLADPALAPAPDHIQRNVDHFREVLQIRKSSPLFRLQTEAEVIEHLSFLNTGPEQIPGLIVMRLADPSGAIDQVTAQIVVLFNARPDDVTFAAPALAGLDFRLHPVLQNSSDPVVRTASFRAGDGVFSVPARTTAVFVLYQPAEQINLLIGAVQSLLDDGTLNRGQANALITKLETALRALERGQVGPALNALAAFTNQVDAFESAGILSAEQAAALREAAGSVMATLNAG